MTQFDDSKANAKLAELRHREEESLVAALAPRYGYEYIDLGDMAIDADALRILTEEESRRAEAAIFAQGNGTISLAIRNPNHPEVPSLIERLTGMRRTPHVYMASMASLEHAWERYQDAKQTKAETRGVLDLRIDVINKHASEIKTYLDVGTKVATASRAGGPEKITEVIELLFGGALALGASDIHIEPAQMSARVRYRLDGVLSDVTDVDRYLYEHIISRLKLLSGLKLNLHKIAQDGRFSLELGKREIEVRSSVIPGGFGESIVMRLLDPDASNFKSP
jgi:type II secretory ATPase GspE/PulE/Tfp pilus assembly ATPase PilB-like protein